MFKIPEEILIPIKTTATFVKEAVEEWREHRKKELELLQNISDQLEALRAQITKYVKT
jgi:hypothetical protein